ncbi:hypothetical protein M1M07_07615 [Rhodococcus sp. HM1]|uniref:hypothetical protein n=1 Tax=Rhodococcus sp. HM1 TaxID=2937759 RepID=UPI00200B443D|nr:hypothetical protein [Rhodococcus sp. HM1]MCK8670984.1 hypothetical protein [Rhodococcus sp. HM1]
MTDVLIAYGVLALLLALCGAGAWLGHSIFQEARRYRELRSRGRRVPVTDPETGEIVLIPVPKLVHAFGPLTLTRCLRSGHLLQTDRADLITCPDCKRRRR